MTGVSLQLLRSIVGTPTLLLPEIDLTPDQPPRYESSSDSNGAPRTTPEKFLKERLGKRSSSSVGAAEDG